MNEKTKKRLALGWFKILLMTTVLLIVPSMAAHAQESVPPNPVSRIRGTITTCAGVPLAGVTVHIEGDFGGDDVVTDSAGRYFAAFELGTYTVTPIPTTGYFFSPQQIVVAGSNLSANFKRYPRDNRANFDGDCKTDVSIYDQSAGNWTYLSSVNGQTVPAHFGLNGDIMTPGDYNADGKTDLAVFRPSNATWYISTDMGSSFYAVVPFGLSTDIPVARDYDGDAKTDIAVFRPSTGDWHILYSSDNSYHVVHFGANGDRPAPGDYDSDNKGDVAVFRPSNATWYILRSSDGGTTIEQFGLSSDQPVQADYDGDGRTDIAVFRASTGFWYIKNSSDGSIRVESWGLSTDQAAPGDYDGDGRADVAIQRPGTLTWWILYSAGGSNAISFQYAGLPVPAGYLY